MCRIIGIGGGDVEVLADLDLAVEVIVTEFEEGFFEPGVDVVGVYLGGGGVLSIFCHFCWILGRRLLRVKWILGSGREVG